MINMNWQSMIRGWGYPQLAQLITGKWSGDIVTLLRDGDLIGVSVLGYGSCSYCDELESLELLPDPREARIELSAAQLHSVHWYTDYDQFLQHIRTSNPWWAHDDEIMSFIKHQWV